MEINGTINSISYKNTRPQSLDLLDIVNLNINNAPAFFQLKINELEHNNGKYKAQAVLKLTSPKILGSLNELSSESEVENFCKNNKIKQKPVENYQPSMIF